MENEKKRRHTFGRTLLWSVAGIAVIAAAGVFGGKVVLEKTVRTSLEKSGTQAASINIDFTGHVHLNDVTVPLEEGQSLRLASMETRPEFLFLSGMIDARDITFDAGPMHVSVPSILVEDAGINRAFLAAASGEADLTPAERVRRFSAGRVTMPTINVTQSQSGVDQTTTYSDVVLEDIVDGHVGSYSASGMTSDTELAAIPNEDGDAGRGTVKLSVGAIEGQDIDGPFLTRIYTEAKPADGANPAQQVYGPVTAKDFVMETADGRVTYAEMKSDGFSMRLAEEPFLTTLENLEALSANAALSPDDEERLGLEAFLLLETIAKGDLQISGIGLTSDAEPDMTFAIGSLAVTFDDLVLGFSMDGLDVRGGDNALAVKSASWTDFSLAPTLAGIREYLKSGPGEPEMAWKTAFLPAFGTLQVTDYAVNLKPGTDNGFDVEEPVNVAVKDFSLALKDPVNGIPSEVRMMINELKLNLAENDDNEALALLRQLGYEEVTISENFALRWDKTNNELIVEDISLSGEDMGSISLSGVVGGFGEAFFSGDTSLMQAALFGLTGRELTLKLENEGLFARGLKLYADRNGMSEEQAALTLSMLPSIAAQTVGEGDPGVQALIDAVSAFIADPNTLEIAIAAKSDQGIGAPAFMAATMDPASLLQQVDITAQAD
ncbi:hypothetical protein FF124_17495 [Martelella lutilitoris]|uniref:Uncharacterized protein n=1 Tax=Martelella lutilitoris TaxID=2583532 RepID=A0A5C4JM05_9HYPH|nr:hypothetical protein [Martelella lutilitoris]TNB46330.1 hypothetical protein FF124_17495 [Martelella lutilitoris]